VYSWGGGWDAHYFPLRGRDRICSEQRAECYRQEAVGIIQWEWRFYGTVLDTYAGNPGFNENSGIHFTTYISNLDAIANIFQENSQAYVALDISNSSFMIYFDGPNCTGTPFFYTINGFFQSYQPQVLFSHRVTEQYFVVTSQPVSLQVSQSALDSTGACTNATQSIEFGKTARKVALPFSLQWPLTIKLL
jgi:hypothetical protein